MTWAIQYAETAAKQLAKLDKAVAKKLVSYLADTAKLKDPAERGHALTGPLAGHHRYRLGQLRLIVKIQRNTITIAVLNIGKRDSIY